MYALNGLTHMLSWDKASERSYTLKGNQEFCNNVITIIAMPVVSKQFVVESEDYC